MPRTESNALGGLPFTSADFCDFRALGPRMRLDDLPAPPITSVARVFAPEVNVDSSPGRGWISRTADNDFAPVIAVPTAVSEGSAEASATTTSVVQPTPPRSSVQKKKKELTQPSPRARPRPSLPRLALRRPRRWRSLQTASPLGRAGVQQQQLVRHPLLSTLASVPAGPLGHLCNPIASPTTAAGSARHRDPCSCQLAGPHGAASVRPRPRRAYKNSSLTVHAFSW